MADHPVVADQQRSRAIAILLGGGTAATLDLIYAFVLSGMHGRSAQWVMQSIASGLTGSAAFESGAGGAALGAVAHYAILFVAAAVYCGASRRLRVLRTHAAICGIVFGVLVYLFMNFVVLPLSAFPFKVTYPPATLLRGFVSHGLLVGLPIALASKRFDG